MYGVPENLDLAFLSGAELIQVCLGQYQVAFHFHPQGHIYVQGPWELFDASGQCIDRSREDRDHHPYWLHRLLGRSVVGRELSPPRSFSLRFDGGELLRIFDDSQQYESFQIQPGDIIV